MFKKYNLFINNITKFDNYIYIHPPNHQLSWAHFNSYTSFDFHQDT